MSVIDPGLPRGECWSEKLLNLLHLPVMVGMSVVTPVGMSVVTSIIVEAVIRVVSGIVIGTLIIVTGVVTGIIPVVSSCCNATREEQRNQRQ